MTREEAKVAGNMMSEEAQQAREWVREHPPRTFETMDAETKLLYKQNMGIIKADMDAWLQQANPEGYAMLLAEASQDIAPGLSLSQAIQSIKERTDKVVQNLSEQERHE